ncbi:arsenite methyltransferase [Nesterenkonia marinintestina]|uniref:arsenite methyltransferase n=1 Tax=Nesterenkonia marinintestina TaxID=2979865 RepID=UPI0021BFAF78|nr:arsenite methyltransferase [Nesterenkonia sp. GX14115]
MTTSSDELREAVRRRYADAALRLTGTATGCCGTESTTDLARAGIFGSSLYDADASASGGPAVEASLGCGVPTAVAELVEGETVLDLGSGAGGDVLISARRVGPEGRAIGLDMTEEMLEAARRHAAEAGADNVEFVRGYLEEVPLPEASVDVVISNCVINLAADKDVVLQEAARVTRPGGRFAVSDVVASEDMDEATRHDVAAHTGCIAGALTETEYRRSLERAGWTDVDITYTHRVHSHAQAAIIRAERATGRGTDR